MSFRRGVAPRSMMPLLHGVSQAVAASSELPQGRDTIAKGNPPRTSPESRTDAARLHLRQAQPRRPRHPGPRRPRSGQPPRPQGGCPGRSAVRRRRGRRPQRHEDHGRPARPPRQAPGDRAGRRRRGQHRRGRRNAAGRRRHEHAGRQHSLGRGTHDRPPDGPGPARRRGRRQHENRQVGARQVPRHPARRQDARRHRPGSDRPRSRPPCRRAGHEGGRLRPARDTRTGGRLRHQGRGRPRRTARAVRLRVAAHPAQRFDPRLPRGARELAMLPRGAAC